MCWEDSDMNVDLWSCICTYRFNAQTFSSFLFHLQPIVVMWSKHTPLYFVEFGKVVLWSEVSFCSRFLFWMSQRKLAETRKYYATYNALAEAHELTMKETSLLNSIHSQACTLFSLFLLSYLEFVTVLCRGLVTGSSQMDFMWFVAR